MHSSACKSRVLTTGLIIANLGLIGVWLRFAPPGLEGKLNAIGYAICHQISSHSIHFGSSQLPLCARCTGLFMGALAGSLILLQHGRRGQLPAKKFVWLMVILALGFVIDGINSTLFFFDGWKGIYPPNNLLRLVTGLGMGIVSANLLIPLWNQILWSNWVDQPLLDSSRQFLVQVGLTALIGALLNSSMHFLFLPAAILSTLSVVLLLTMIYTLLWTMGLRKENTFTNLKQMFNVILLGFLTTAIQFEGMALFRYILTHTWAGFQI